MLPLCASTGSRTAARTQAQDFVVAQVSAGPALERSPHVPERALRDFGNAAFVASSDELPSVITISYDFT
jgi:hypothetical protein